MIFNQQSFMGASIRSFNASLGWGTNPSNFDVNLVCDPNRYPLYGEVFTPTDVGLPSTFVFSGIDDSQIPFTPHYWKFTGIVKNYRQNNSAAGNPLFSVSMSDPREILGGTQLILDNYFGSVSGIPNILNVFGAVEDINKLITPLGNYGSMQKNDTGIPWTIVRDAIHYLTSGILTPHYGDYIKYKDRKYTVNLSSLPQVSSGYRIPNTSSMSLLNYIDDVCKAASYDYFVVLNPLYTTDILNNSIPILDENLHQYHEIQVKTISRAYLPQPSAIINFVSSVNGASVKNIGVELRNASTAKFLLGGNISSMYQVFDSGWNIQNDITYEYDNIHQYYGTNANGNLLPELRPSPDNYIGPNKKANPVIIIDTRDLDNRVYPGSYYATDLNELQSCLSSIEAWKNYLSQNEVYKYIPVNKADSQILNKANASAYDVTDGVLSEYCGPFENGVINKNNKVLSRIIIEVRQPVNNQVTNFVYFATYDIFLPGDFAIQYADLHFPPVLLNNAPAPNPSLLAAGTPVVDVSRTDIVYQAPRFLANKLEYRYVYVYTYLPLDLHAFSHALYHPIYSISNIDVIGTAGFYAGMKFAFPLPQQKKPEYVKYYHTYVPNPHYKKAALLRLTNTTNQKEMIKAIGLMSKLIDTSGPQPVIDATIAKDLQTALSATDMDIVQQETENMRIQSFYDFLSQFAHNIGTKYMVNMPQMLVARDNHTSGIFTSISPVNEGYISELDTKLALSVGLLPPNYYKLTTADNRLAPYAFYPSAHLYNLTSISDNDICYTYGPDGSRKDAYIKCSVEENVRFVDRYAAPSSTFPKAIINLPQIINYKEEFDTQASLGTLGFLANLSGIQSQVTNLTNVIGGDDLYEFMISKPVQPMWIAMPVRSNVQSYGPWYNVGAIGTIEYERDESLVPWNYGGYSGLNDSALTKVSQISYQQQDENGDVELPGMPMFTLGSQLEWLSQGEMQYGPYITDINVDFGEGGIKTNYKMQTWTPGFGELGKQHEEDLVRSGKKINELIHKNAKQISDGIGANDKRTASLFKTLMNDEGISKSSKRGLSRALRYQSSHTMMSAQTDGIIESGDNRFNTIVVSQPTYNTATQMSKDYYNKATISLDAIFRPYSTCGAYSGSLSRFELMNEVYSNFVENSLQTVNSLQPFPYGHDIDAVSKGKTIPKNGLVNNNEYDKDNEYRGVGFKNPLIVVGYGRATDGRPVPNASQFITDKNGKYIYNSSGTSDSNFYANDYLNRTDMWKAGPLDIIWEKTRKMWVPGSQLVEGYLVEDLESTEGRFSAKPFTTAKMVLCAGTYASAKIESGFQPKTWDRADASGSWGSGLLATGQSGLLWQSSGSYYGSLGGPVISGGCPDIFILLVNRSTQISALSGTYIIASPMPNGDYRPIWIDCQSSEREGLE